MTSRQVLLVAALAVALLVAVLAASALAGPLVNIIVLFFAGVGAGASIRGLRGAPRNIGVERAEASAPATRRGRSRSADQDRGRGQRQGRKRPARATGKVKWFDDTKGFGFITLDDGKTDCFVHRSAIQGSNSLTEGKRVEFQIVTDDKGRQAAANVVTG